MWCFYQLLFQPPPCRWPPDFWWSRSPTTRLRWSSCRLWYANSEKSQFEEFCNSCSCSWSEAMADSCYWTTFPSIPHSQGRGCGLQSALRVHSPQKHPRIWRRAFRYPVRGTPLSGRIWSAIWKPQTMRTRVREMVGESRFVLIPFRIAWGSQVAELDINFSWNRKCAKF